MENTIGYNSGEAMYWFNWQRISDSGDRFYGKYIYKSVLKILSPVSSLRAEIKCMIMDGDFFSSTVFDRRIPLGHPVMKEVIKQGLDEMFILAIKGDENFDYDKLDSELQSSQVTGYTGMVKIAPMDIKEFYNMGTSMALIFAIEIHEPYLKKIDFGFIGNHELEEIGYKVVAWNPIKSSSQWYPLGT